MKTGVYIGRFNPPQKGHMNIIKTLLRRVDKLIVVIGSAEKINEKENPFSGKERVKMMKAYLKEEGIPECKVKIYTLRDKKSWKGAIDNLLKTCKFDVLFTNKKIIMKKVDNRIKIETFNRTGKSGRISGTRIRNAINKDKEWEHLTGISVAGLIKKMNGIQRIKRAYEK